MLPRNVLLPLLVILTALNWCDVSHAADEYRLGIGDKVRIKVHEWPDLLGEYTVSPSSTVFVPLVGELTSKGLTTGQLAAEISNRLQNIQQLAKPPSTAVEIVAFRPFFVVGDVQRPGEYPFRPGLTVLQAISIAGGYFRATDSLFQREAIVSEGEIAIRQRESKQLNAKIARLEAERAAADSIHFPAEINLAPGSPDRAIAEGEQAILSSNRKALAESLQILDKYQDLYEKEIVTVEEQIKIEKRTYVSVQKEFDSLKQLADRGLTSLSRQLTSERTLAQISANIQGLGATILRARQNISNTEQLRLDKINAQAARINQEMQKAQADLREANERLRTASALRAEASVFSPSSGQSPNTDQKLKISRVISGSVTELDAETSTSLDPGDVLIVDRSRPLGRQLSGWSAQTAPSSEVATNKPDRPR